MSDREVTLKFRNAMLEFGLSGYPKSYEYFEGELLYCGNPIALTLTENEVACLNFALKE